MGSNTSNEANSEGKIPGEAQELLDMVLVMSSICNIKKCLVGRRIGKWT
jgi:hypothetical protein